MPAFFQLLKRFRKDERGVFGVIFAVLAVVLVAVAGCVVDFAYMQTARSRAQTALDAAALALQADMTTTDANTIKAEAQAILVERLADPRIIAVVQSATPNIGQGTLNLQAQLTVPTTFVQLVGVPQFVTHLQSEVTRNSSDLEVSVALDTTGSMGGSKISALIDATNNLIDLIVKDQQPPQAPSYTKMAMVPYSYGVNVNNSDMATYLGTNLINKVRGAEIDGTTITNVGWAVGSAMSIRAISKANPAVVTLQSKTTDFANGAYVYIAGVSGMTNLNGNIYVARNPGSSSGYKTFQLYMPDGTTKVNSSNWNSASGNTGSATQCQLSTCELVFTSAGYNINSGDPVYITGVGGTAVNTANIDTPDHVDQVLTASTFTLSPKKFGPNYAAYTSGGTAYCMIYGCHYFNFTSMSNVGQTFTASTNCVTERTDTHKYDDTGPATSLTAPLTSAVAFMYPSSSGNCERVPLIPLSTDKTKLHAAANALIAAGSTAGHIGLAWAWYMLAPNWGYLWPTASQPAAYKKVNLVKALILMTDGQFNTQYYNGVIAQDSDNIDGSGNMIKHNSNNGESTDQATSLCTAIKSSTTGIILYTVGFDIGSNSTTDRAARTFLTGCASTNADFYLANTAADLNDAFTAIAQNLSALRVSK